MKGISTFSQVIFYGATLLSILAIGFYSEIGYPKNCNVHTEEEPVMVVSISNTTLGFQKFFHVNEATRFDLADVVALQSSVSNVLSDRFDAVSPKTNSDKRMPPAHSDCSLTESEKAVLRSHANLWREMMKNGWQTMLVIEPTAAWDINIRNNMESLSHGFEQLVNSKTENKEYHATQQDPYLHNHWDILRLGGCNHTLINFDESIEYFDADTNPDNIRIMNHTLVGNHRLLSHQNIEDCVGGYAVSLRGAVKLLTRYSYSMDLPLDKMINEMSSEGFLESYSVYPSVFKTWQYQPKLSEVVNTQLGKDDISKIINTNSDIKLRLTTILEEVRNLMKFWVYSPTYRNVPPFKNGTLDNLNELFYGKPKYRTFHNVMVQQ